ARAAPEPVERRAAVDRRRPRVPGQRRGQLRRLFGQGRQAAVVVLRPDRDHRPADHLHDRRRAVRRGAGRLGRGVPALADRLPDRAVGPAAEHLAAAGVQARRYRSAATGPRIRAPAARSAAVHRDRGAGEPGRLRLRPLLQPVPQRRGDRLDRAARPAPQRGAREPRHLDGDRPRRRARGQRHGQLRPLAEPRADRGDPPVRDQAGPRGQGARGPRRVRRVGLRVLAPLALLAAAGWPANGAGTVDSALLAQGSEADWAAHGRTYAEQRWSPLAQIDAGNVSGLGLAWYADLDTNLTQEATPLAIDGKIYVSTAWSKAFAFDAVTGERLWHYDP